jgi:hypothetical protein
LLLSIGQLTALRVQFRGQSRDLLLVHSQLSEQPVPLFRDFPHLVLELRVLGIGHRLDLGPQPPHFGQLFGPLALQFARDAAPLTAGVRFALLEHAVMAGELDLLLVQQSAGGLSSSVRPCGSRCR